MTDQEDGWDTNAEPVEVPGLGGTLVVGDVPWEGGVDYVSIRLKEELDRVVDYDEPGLSELVRELSQRLKRLRLRGTGSDDIVAQPLSSQDVAD